MHLNIRRNKKEQFRITCFNLCDWLESPVTLGMDLSGEIREGGTFRI